MIKKYTVDTPYPVGPVHLYVKEYDGFQVLFDTGPNTAVAKNFLKEKIDFKNLKYVFITHCHADHYGLVKFIKDNSDAEIFISKYDYFRLYYLEFEISVMKRILVEDIGLPEIAVRNVMSVLTMFSEEVPVPNGLKILEEEAEIVLNELGISYERCAGHSQSDIVYLIDDFAITGDILLRGIFQTPLLDVDVDNKDRRFYNYEHFCKTIVKMSELEERYRFLPGHRDYIDSVKERVIFYVEKMSERISNLEKYLRKSDIVGALKFLIPNYENEPFKTYIKLSEIVFFHDFIKNPDLLFDSLQKIGIEL